eukprot:gene13090-3621_t
MSQMPGYMRRMAITRSMFAVNGNDASMGAENGVELLYHPRWKTHLLYAETHSLVATYNATKAAMSGDFSFSKTMYLPSGHYHLVVVDNYIFAAHTGTGEAIMVDQEGTVVNRFPCAGCHGSEKYETEEYTILLFGCIDSVLAVTVPHSHTGEDNHTGEEHPPSEDNHTGEEHHPSEDNHTGEEQHPSEENHTSEEQHPSEENHTSEEDHTGHDHDRRLASTSDVTATYINASNPRIGGVFWTAAQSGPFIATPRFYRTDSRGTPNVTLTNHSGTGLGSDGFVIRAQGLPSKHRMLAIHRVGLMVMYHGVTGEAISSINLSEGGFSANFAAPFVTPFLCNSTVFITVPATGNVHEILVNFTSGVMSMGRVLSLGGQPQMALADSKGEAGQLEPERPKLQRYHLTSNRVHTSAFQGDKILHSSMATATSKRAEAAELPLTGNRGARINFRGTKNAQSSIATSNAAGAAEAADLPLTGNREVGNRWWDMQAPGSVRTHELRVVADL